MTQQKLALITGASRGFGAAIAKLLAPTHHIIAVARTTGALEELDDEIQSMGGSATLVPTDITDSAGLGRMGHSIHDRWGGLDLWIHAAIHAAPLCPTEHVDAKDWAKSININVTATSELIVNIDPLLRARNGTAVYLDDPMQGQKFFATYGASKAAQKALFDSWAIETASAGSRVMSFTPSPMPTATRARFFPGEDRTLLSEPKVEAARLLAELAL